VKIVPRESGAPLVHDVSPSMFSTPAHGSTRVYAQSLPTLATAMIGGASPEYVAPPA
jgi:hypothetical protein